tara:strand:+ start:9443 stop:9931 length:489 start_codon:yes stop_codon:yes gene_type:complete
MTYEERVKAAIDAIDEAQVAQVIEALRIAPTVYVLGNGGSHANAAHLVLHLRDAGIPAFDVLGDPTWLSACSNDTAYDLSPAAYLRVEQPGDTLVVLSGSGRSENVLYALQNYSGPKIGFLGSSGGEAAQLCDIVVALKETEYGPIEDAHSVILHMIAEALK